MMTTEGSARWWTAARHLYRARMEGEILVPDTYEGTLALSYSAMTRCYTASVDGRIVFNEQRKEAQSALAALYN